MIPITYLPLFVRALFQGMPGVWRSRHQLFFCWLVLMQAIFPDRKTLKGMSRSTPSHITEWRFRRLLKAGYWSIRIILIWFAQEAIACFPSPKDGVLFIIADSSKKNKRGKKNPVAQKGRKGKNQPYYFGIRFVLIIASWGVYRIPVDFRIILPKNHPDYKKENELFREMIKGYEPPKWAKLIIIEGDSAYASKDNIKTIKEKDKSDCKRAWKFVFSLPKTWNMKNGKKIKDLAIHTPKKCFKRTWIPRLSARKGRKTFWVFGKTVSLNHIGEVTIVLSKKGPNVSPKNIKVIVTNLTGLTPRQIVILYNRRWGIEIVFKELKSGLGLGEHQVTKTEDRVEKSIGISIIAYLFLIRFAKDDIRPGKSWSIFQLQNNLRLKVLTNQVEHNMELKLKNLQKSA